MKKIFTLLFFIAISVGMMGQAGQLNKEFGNGGVIKKINGTGQPSIHIAKQAFPTKDGRILLATQLQDKTIISRLLSNGSIDSTYGRNGFSMAASVYVQTAVLQSDGKIISIGGSNFSNAVSLARFNLDGTIDNTFGNVGLATFAFNGSTLIVHDAKSTDDDKIVAAATMYNDGKSSFAILKFTKDGQLDASFGVNGLVTTNFDNVNSDLAQIALQKDGKIIAAGTVYTEFGYRFGLAKLMANGQPDPSFNLTGKLILDQGIWEQATAITLDKNERIYVGGNTSTNTGSHIKIVRLLNDGIQDYSYNQGNGFMIIDFGDSYDLLSHLAIQFDGSLVADGSTNLNTQSRDILLSHIYEDGTLDTKFGGNGFLKLDIDNNSDQSNFLILLSNGDILTGGFNFNNNDYTQKFSCFRCKADGTPDITFGIQGAISGYKPGSDLQFVSCFNQSDGKLKAIGTYLDINKAATSLYSFSATGVVDDGFGDKGVKLLSNSEGFYYPIFQPDGKVLTTAYSPAYDGDLILKRYNSDGSPDANFGNNGTVISDLGGTEFPGPSAIQKDGKILVAGYLRDNNGTDLLIVRYNSDGSLDRSFGTNGTVRKNIQIEEYGQTIKIMPNGKILIGGYSLNYSANFNFFNYDVFLLCLNTDGSLDESFSNVGLKIIDRSTTEFLGTLAIQNDGKIVLTTFNQAEGQTYYSTILERLNTDGSEDLSFSNGQNIVLRQNIANIKLQDDNKIILIGTQMDSAQGVYNYFLQRFTSNGQVDNSFGNSGSIAGSLSNKDTYIGDALISNNSLFVSGGGRNEWGDYLGLIAKFQLESPLTISCPGNQIVSTDKGKCSAVVNNIDPTPTCNGNEISYKLTGATIANGRCSASGVAFNKGITTVTYTLDADTTKNCSFTVTVQDNEAPVITNLSTNIKELWPADRKLKDVTVNYTATDNCSIVSTKLSVTSNESLAPADYQIIDDHHIRLRADRSNSGNGRIYTITATSTDAGGLSSKAATTVTVPKNKKQPKLTVQVANNPTNKEFTIAISSDTRDMINATVFNGNGVVIKQLNNLLAPYTLKIGSNYLPGAYYIRVTQADVSQSTKLIKQ